MKIYILIFLYFQLSLIIHINANPMIERNWTNVVVPAQENEFPFIVSLAYAPATVARNHFCGGTLISRRHILTAEHCFVNMATRIPLTDISDIRVIIGSIDMRCGRKLRITAWKTFVDWARENNIHDRIAAHLYHDLAIATLSEEVVDIRPATISQLNDSQLHGKAAVIAGWGIGNKGVESPLLKKAYVQVISREQCRINFNNTLGWPNMSINHLCTMQRPPVILGPGDSGGPLLLNGTLIGVNESVCANNIEDPNEQNVHQSAEYYREFIEAFAERTQ